MRFLADENFPGDAVTALRTSGQDVLWIRTDAPGITDQDVLARSLKLQAGMDRVRVASTILNNYLKTLFLALFGLLAIGLVILDMR
jgi:hypothetical protein